MVESVKTYDAKTLFGVSRAFSSFLALANAAGNHQRVRRRKEKILLSKTKYGLHPEGDSSSGRYRTVTFCRLIEAL